MNADRIIFGTLKVLIWSTPVVIIVELWRDLT
jgi:hypothetical protein